MKHKVGICFVLVILFGVFALSNVDLYAQSCPGTPGIYTIVITLRMPDDSFPESLTFVEWTVKNASDGFAESCPISTHTYNSSNGVFTINAANICNDCPDGQKFDVQENDVITITVTGTSTGMDPQTKTIEVVADGTGFQNIGDITLPVELSAFEAIGGDGVVLLKWATESEIDNQGFHVYRSASEKGEYARITNQMIKGAGTSTSRQDYQYEDRNVENGQTYYYKLEDVDFAGNRRNHGPVSATPDNGKVIQGLVPDKFALDQNYPNPFNPETTISYDLPEGTFVTLDIYNLMGQKIRTLVNEEKPAGSYPVKWNGLDDNGRPVATGLYVYTIKAGSFSQTKKMLFLK